MGLELPHTALPRAPCLLLTPFLLSLLLLLWDDSAQGWQMPSLNPQQG